MLMLACGSCSEKKDAGGQQVQPVKVKTLTVASASQSSGREYSGVVEEESGTSLSFSSVGTVKSIHVHEGQFIRKGQLIGTLDATSARNAYEMALATKEQALDAQERMKMLHDAGSLPEVKWVEVETQVRQALASEQIARKALSDMQLVAPFSGYVAAKTAEAGTNVAPGVPVVKLVRIDQVKVNIGVPEEEISQIRQGQTVSLRVSALGDRQFEGRVVEKGVSADPLSRTYDVKIVVTNSGHELLPGMLATATMPDAGRTEAGSQSITVPLDIVQLEFDNRRFVWCAVDGKAKKTYIETGSVTGDRVTVVSGLQPGDKVITEGQQKVSSGMEVKE